MAGWTDRIKVKATKTTEDDQLEIFIVMQSMKYQADGHSYPYTHYFVYAKHVDHWQEQITLSTINKKKAIEGLQRYIGMKVLEGFKLEVLKGE